jgi:hypothetical protein
MRYRQGQLQNENDRLRANHVPYLSNIRKPSAKIVNGTACKSLETFTRNANLSKYFIPRDESNQMSITHLLIPYNFESVDREEME